MTAKQTLQERFADGAARWLFEPSELEALLHFAASDPDRAALFGVSFGFSENTQYVYSTNGTRLLYRFRMVDAGPVVAPKMILRPHLEIALGAAKAAPDSPLGAEVAVTFKNATMEDYEIQVGSLKGGGESCEGIPKTKIQTILEKFDEDPFPFFCLDLRLLKQLEVLGEAVGPWTIMSNGQYQGPVRLDAKTSTYGWTAIVMPVRGGAPPHSPAQRYTK